jgi:N utilization substance protein A
MKSEFEVAFSEIADQRALPREIVMEALSYALVTAYQRDSGIGKAQKVEATIDPNTGRAKIFVEKEVVEEVFDKRTEVDLENARFFVPEAQIGDMVMVELEGATTKKFGRIAAQTAKQVILQRIREAERSTLYEEFMEREGDVVVGTVQSVNPNMVTLSLGRAEAIMPRNQQIPNERYKPHEKIRVYIVEVKKHSRGPQIVVSRSHRNMLRRLLEYEVPEIYNGQVEIKSIAREAGYRSKVAVAALQEGIDPVGACVGMKGVRIQNIVKELHEEKIDVIEWKPRQEEFIAAALSPAHVKGVYLEDDIDTGRTAIVIVPDDELSLAIGKEGANARLAAKLTGWRIDIKSVSEAVTEALDDQTTPTLVEFKAQNPDMVAEVRRIMDKIATKRVVMPEEFTYLARFADQAQRRIMQMREQARQKRIAEINAVKETLPAGAFAMPVEDLPVSEPIIEALRPLQNVGEVMLRFLIDDNKIRHLLRDAPPGAFDELQAALDQLVIPEEMVARAEEQRAAAEAERAALEAEQAAALSTAGVHADDTAVVRDAFVDEPEPSAQRKPQPAPRYQPPVAEPLIYDDESEDEEDETPARKGQKKGKKKKGALVFDERTGGVVRKKQRKGSRAGHGWDDWEI